MKDVCYLIPYYNAYADLLKSLQSLCEGVDVLIVDDGSDEPLEQLLNASDYQFSIKILTLHRNQGIEHALNLGVQHITGSYKYIARLDAGDLSAPDRVKRQLSAVEDGDGVVLIGGWANFVNEDYQYIFTSKLPTTDEAIRKNMYLNNVFVHPSVLISVEAINEVGGYPVDVKCAEDYGLFFELMKLGKVKNLPNPLIEYVISPYSISTVKRKLQIKSRLKVLLRNYKFKYSFFFVRGVFRCVLSYMAPRKLTTFLRRFISVYE